MKSVSSESACEHSTPLGPVEGPVKSGYLKKRSNGGIVSGIIKPWQKRYFILKDGFLSWYSCDDKEQPLGGIYVSSVYAMQLLAMKRSRVLEIKAHKGSSLKAYLLQAASTDRARQWLEAIEGEFHRVQAVRESSLGVDPSRGRIAMAFLLPSGRVQLMEMQETCTGPEVKAALFARLDPPGCRGHNQEEQEEEEELGGRGGTHRGATCSSLSSSHQHHFRLWLQPSRISPTSHSGEGSNAMSVEDNDADPEFCFLDEFPGQLKETSFYQRCRAGSAVVRVQVVTLTAAKFIQKITSARSQVRREVSKLLGQTSYPEASYYDGAFIPGGSAFASTSEVVPPPYLVPNSAPVLLPCEVHAQGWRGLAATPSLGGVCHVIISAELPGMRVVELDGDISESILAFKQRVLTTFLLPDHRNSQDGNNSITVNPLRSPSIGDPDKYLLKLDGQSAYLDTHPPVLRSSDRQSKSSEVLRLGDLLDVRDCMLQGEPLHLTVVSRSSVTQDASNSEDPMAGIQSEFGDEELVLLQDGPSWTVQSRRRVKEHTQLDPKQDHDRGDSGDIQHVVSIPHQGISSFNTPPPFSRFDVARNGNCTLSPWQNESALDYDIRQASKSSAHWQDTTPFRLKVSEIFGLEVGGFAAKGTDPSLGSQPLSDLFALIPSTVMIAAGLYHSGEMLSENMELKTHPVVLRPQTRVDQWLTFPLPLSSLPRDARICFTVYTQEEGGKLCPLGWVNLLLIDHSGTLRHGVVSLRLWPGGVCNPIAPCVENLNGTEPARLFVEFDSYVEPVKFEDFFPGPILPGSQRCSFAVEKIDLGQMDSADTLAQSSTNENETPRGSANASEVDSEDESDSCTESSGIPGASPRISRGGRRHSNHSSHTREMEVSPFLRRALLNKHESATSRSSAPSLRTDVGNESEFQDLPRPSKIEEFLLNDVISSDPLVSPSTNHRIVLWKYRRLLTSKAAALPKFLRAVDYLSKWRVVKAYRLLPLWCSPLPLEVALELLGAKFSDTKVRAFAVESLSLMSDFHISSVLLQLVQAVKLESSDWPAVSQLLLTRALRNPVIGHQMFWLLKSEMHVPEISHRYGMLLAEYLKRCGQYRSELIDQVNAVEELLRVALTVRRFRGGAQERLNVLRRELTQARLPPTFRLPFNPRLKVGRIVPERCKFMDSKKLPLFLVFESASGSGRDGRSEEEKSVAVIFKSGDDLRQDMLTLQLLSVMDSLWRSSGLDLCMSCYGCVATGEMSGVIQVVDNCTSTSEISKQAGGGTACFREEPLAEWLRQHNPSDAEYARAVDRFIRSCAGYCVATCVMGIGDRHNDNIMVKRTGELFHIDFGHFLGNFKSKFGFKRERARFVFTPDYAYVMGGTGGEGFQRFCDICRKAFSILRSHANLIITLFELMLSAGIPELQSVQNIAYLRDTFKLEMSSFESEEVFVRWIFESLNCKATQLNHAIHTWVH